jgi:hypothetical protein
MESERDDSRHISNIVGRGSKIFDGGLLDESIKGSPNMKLQNDEPDYVEDEEEEYEEDEDEEDGEITEIVVQQDEADIENPRIETEGRSIKDLKSVESDMEGANSDYEF